MPTATWLSDWTRRLSQSREQLFLDRTYLAGSGDTWFLPPAVVCRRGKRRSPFQSFHFLEGEGLVSRAGFEPATNGLKVRCSTTELPARISVELVYCTSGIRPALRNAGLEAGHRQPTLKTIRMLTKAWGRNRTSRCRATQDAHRYRQSNGGLPYVQPPPTCP